MWKYLGVVAAAILLGMVSPLVAAVRDGLLQGTEVMMAALALLIIAAQYLLIVLLLTPLRPTWLRVRRRLFAH